MEGRSKFLHRREREELRERWLLRAGQAFERMFAEENQDQLVTFRQREDLAVTLSRELAAFLMEEHVAADVQVHHSDQRPPCCPRCEQPGQRVTSKQETLPERALTHRSRCDHAATRAIGSTKEKEDFVKKRIG